MDQTTTKWTRVGFLAVKLTQLGAESKRKGFFFIIYNCFGPFGRFRELGSWVPFEAVEGMFYGAVSWDPWLIIVQVVYLQCLYYLTLGVFMAFLVGTRVSRMSLVYFFDYAAITASTVTGWCVIASFLLSSLAGSVYMLHLIERAKKCLDFSATVYINHLFICIIYGGWPSSLTWWIVNGTGIAVMALLGKHLCMRRELQEIPIMRFRSNFGRSAELNGQEQISLQADSARIYFD